MITHYIVLLGYIAIDYRDEVLKYQKVSSSERPSFEFKDGISVRDRFGAPTRLQLLRALRHFFASPSLSCGLRFRPKK